MTAPRDATVGDTVRITIETTLTEDTYGPLDGVLVGHFDGCDWYLDGVETDARRIVSIEVLEPAWQPGDVIRDATGNLWMRDDHDQWYGVRDGGGGDRIAPLTLLVRDGKTVTP